MGSRKEIKQLKNSIIDSFVFILRQISSIIEVLSLFDSFNYCYNTFHFTPFHFMNETKMEQREKKVIFFLIAE